MRAPVGLVGLVLDPDHDGDVVGVDVEKQSGGDQDQDRTEEPVGDQTSVDKQRGKIDKDVC